MKCDELKVYVHKIKKSVTGHTSIGLAYYSKSEVDAAIAELKQKLEDAKATAYAESVDAGMRERKLKRALYKACANWADVVAFEETEGIGYDNSVAERWRKMERKCLKKVEEYE